MQEFTWVEYIIALTALFGAVTGGLDLFYFRLWGSRRSDVKVECRKDLSRHSYIGFSGNESFIQPTFLIKAINRSPQRVCIMDKVGFHKVNRFKKNRLIEIFLSCLQNVLRALRIRRLQAIHIGRITNNIPGIMSDGKFPFRLEPGESCEVRAWGMYELIGDVGNKRENELLFINAFFKDTEGRVHECEAPAKALTIDQMPPFRGMFQ